MTQRLILFDVDGTLIQRGDPAHTAAIDDGVHARFPEAAHISVHHIDFDGKLDRQIVRAMLAAAGLDGTVTVTELDEVFRISTEAYRAAWDGQTSDSDLLPGVRTLLEQLDNDPRFALGVLTGGVRGIVAAKLRRLGIDHFFPIGSFGDEAETRPELLPLAVERAAAHWNKPFPANRVVLVGDTPHDVDCAHAGGAAVLGVATGRYATDTLQEAGADIVLDDLKDTERVIDALLTLTGS